MKLITGHNELNSKFLNKHVYKFIGVELVNFEFTLPSRLIKEFI